MKTWPDIKNLVLLLNEEICRSSEGLSNMASQINNKNWCNFGFRIDFDLQFFKKSYFWKVFSLSKIKFHKIRCRSWNEVPVS